MTDTEKICYVMDNKIYDHKFDATGKTDNFYFYKCNICKKDYTSRNKLDAYCYHQWDTRYSGNEISNIECQMCGCQVCHHDNIYKYDSDGKLEYSICKRCGVVM